MGSTPAGAQLFSWCAVNLELTRLDVSNNPEFSFQGTNFSNLLKRLSVTGRFCREGPLLLHLYWGSMWTKGDRSQGRVLCAQRRVPWLSLISRASVALSGAVSVLRPCRCITQVCIALLCSPMKDEM